MSSLEKLKKELKSDIDNYINEIIENNKSKPNIILNSLLDVIINALNKGFSIKDTLEIVNNRLGEAKIKDSAFRSFLKRKGIGKKDFTEVKNIKLKPTKEVLNVENNNNKDNRSKSNGDNTGNNDINDMLSKIDELNNY